VFFFFLKNHFISTKQLEAIRNKDVPQSYL